MGGGDATMGLIVIFASQPFLRQIFASLQENWKQAELYLVLQLLGTPWEFIGRTKTNM